MGLFTEVYIYRPFYRSVHLWAFLQKCTSIGLFTEVYIYGPFYRSVHLWAFLQKCTSMGLFTEVYIYGPLEYFLGEQMMQMPKLKLK